MNRVCIVIRVYNRVEDLENCINIIKDTWKLLNYYIIVVANGESDGYIISDTYKSKIDCFIGLKNNIGHFTGNSQLLLESLRYIPEDCDYTIILEADTWIFGDTLIKKYISKLEDQDAVWASAQFFSYVLNLATDFAIVKTAFVKAHKEIFTFTGTPEYYVANYLKDNGFKFIYIKENMPINPPRYIKKFPYAPTGRFFVFPKGKMVTHHVENLKGGMAEKKLHFNVVAGIVYFNVTNKVVYKLERFKMYVSIIASYIFPHKGWFIKTKKT